MEDIREILIRVDERLLHVKETQDRHVEQTAEVLNDHENRIRKNTTFRNWMAGALGVSTTGLGAAIVRLFGGQ